jgi:hypothetical protein
MVAKRIFRYRPILEQSIQKLITIKPKFYQGRMLALKKIIIK